ncbi:glucose-1-phosphate thymidyltransferase [Pyrolobus fumarii 1A]|uniref:Glucose-1-phosphate thymidyltransferase n=1 Tax=Pyrolobus fumarii (strain DSM 11204 / 1A) TaxID=694429 RepID=G0EHH5_PYRF1|nr:glucose-1-phosphate thymidylyltransferase [Pyrolobus fumarii]AEM38550.1 glucose-1-phosphate thymidyltransferase [Pyrolobus fumarii 1A]
MHEVPILGAGAGIVRGCSVEKSVGIIPAAGEGTRLRPITFSLPKHLVPLLGKAIIEYPLQHLESIQVRDIVIVVGYLGHMIREYLEDKGYRAKYVYQEKRLGIAHAIHTAIEQAGISGSPLVVYLGDNILLEKLETHYKAFIEGDYDVYVLLAPVPDPHRFGVAVVESGRIVKLVEKPREPPSNLAVVGVYMFRDSDLVEKLFRELKPSWRGEYEITDLIQKFIDRGYRVGYSVVSRWWKDIGTPEGLLDAMQMLLDAIEEPVIRGRVEGNVTTSKVIVEEGAVVEGDIKGPAYIGRGSLVSSRARLEAYVSLEQGTILKSGVLVNTLVMGEGTTIDIGEAQLEDSVIGRACEILAHRTTNRMKLLVGDRARITID